jgi:hypothetical protein
MACEKDSCIRVKVCSIAGLSNVYTVHVYNILGPFPVEKGWGRGGEL